MSSQFRLSGLPLVFFCISDGIFRLYAVDIRITILGRMPLEQPRLRPQMLSVSLVA